MFFKKQDSPLAPTWEIVPYLVVVNLQGTNFPFSGLFFILFFLLTSMALVGVREDEQCEVPKGGRGPSYRQEPEEGACSAPREGFLGRMWVF